MKKLITLILLFTIVTVGFSQTVGIISGRIVDSNNRGISNVQLRIEPILICAFPNTAFAYPRTNSFGLYFAQTQPECNILVTPYKKGYFFHPNSYLLAVGGDRIDVNFVGERRG